MGRQRAKPKPKTQPPADVSPFDSDDDEDDVTGGGIPDDDGWIHLEGKESKHEDEAKPKRRSIRRPS
jgi:hypothetical protein